MQPIWIDYYVDLSQYFGSAQFVDYRIEKWGEPIYNGRAYKTPDGNTRIRINDICADYLGHSALLDVLDSGADFLVDTEAIVTFDIYVIAGLSTELVESVQFVNDWSYVLRPPALRQNLSGTISKEYVDFMPFVYSREFVGIGSRTRIEHHIVPEQSLGYKKISCCNPAALYFYNAHGGWDFLLCKGGAKRLHNYERGTVKREYSNGTNERGTVNYQNIERIEWECYTGRIKDSGAANIGQLVGSCDVWLWTPESGLVPVVITTSEAQELTYKNNGRRPVEYTLRVELAQDRQRR